MKTKLRELHFRRRSTLHNIGEFYLSDYGRQPQFGQNSILAISKAKIRNWKIINCFYIYMCVKPFSLTKNEGKLFLVPKSSGPLLAGLPLNLVPRPHSRLRLRKTCKCKTGSKIRRGYQARQLAERRWNEEEPGRKS